MEGNRIAEDMPTPEDWGSVALGCMSVFVFVFFAGLAILMGYAAGWGQGLGTVVIEALYLLHRRHANQRAEP
jgi:thiamine transporter ThiT